MRNFLIIFAMVLCLSVVSAIADDSQEAKPTETTTEETQKDCKKVCVKRDGYGLCTEFEQRCEE